MRPQAHHGLARLCRTFVGGFLLSFVFAGLLGLAARFVVSPAGAQEPPAADQPAPAAPGAPPPAAPEAGIAVGTHVGDVASTTGERLRSVVGLFVIVGIAFLLSKHKGQVNWVLVGVGIGLQAVFAVLVLKTAPGRAFFEGLNTAFLNIIDWTVAGSSFVFGAGGGKMSSGGVFAFSVLSTIIFFSALMSILYHFGFMQVIVRGVAWVMFRTMRTSGAETLSAAANIFVGQTEAPLIIKPYVEKMTESELMCVMTGGFATVAGGVMGAYVFFLQEQFPNIAGHLMAASVMSAPAALVCAKIMLPETGTAQTAGTMEVPVERVAVNSIDAACKGAADGVKLAINVAGMLVAFIALVAMFNTGFGWLGSLPMAHAGATLSWLALASWLVFWRSRAVAYRTKERAGAPGLRDGGPLAGALFLLGATGLLVGGLSLPYPVPQLSWPFLSYGWLHVQLLSALGQPLAVLSLGAAIFFGGVGVAVWRRARATESYVPLDGQQTGSLAFGAACLLAAAPVSLFPYPFAAHVIERGVAGLVWVASGFPDREISVAIAGKETLAALLGAETMSIEVLLGYALWPLAWIMGTPSADCQRVGSLIGIKTVVNEFVAYLQLANDLKGGVPYSPRAVVIATYALCGFSNFSSIGIQIGGIGGIAPGRASDLARIGLRAMIAGSLACFMTAAVAGALI